jgi:sodium pump decarboxylase gamma subunit
MLLNINWSNTFTITGLGLLIVFFVLILLVLLLNLFGLFFGKKEKKTEEKPVIPAEQNGSDLFSENEQAAIAAALHLFYADVHDEESYVITIGEQQGQSVWNSKIQAAHEF